ncbi:MAG: DUF748 domain-containing protein [Myxococcota bacterium]|nr:DUF748 domain-containing protein [Myxococcota bacterium]
MRLLVRVALVLVLLVGVAVGAALLLLPGYLEGEAVGGQLRAAARAATGREVGWDGLSFAVFPPRLVVEHPTVRASAESEEALARAERVALQIELLPLLARALVVDSLVLEGVEVSLVRTDDGIELPLRPGDSDAADPGGAAGFALAVRELRLSDSVLRLEDRTVDPPARWELRELNASARGSSLDAPLDLELSAALASGGRAKLSGTLTLDGPVIDLDVGLEAFDLAPVTPYLGDDVRLAGRVAGSAKVRGPVDALEAIDLDLDIEESDLAMDQVAVRGRVTMAARLRGALAAPEGDFEIDATRASLDYGGAFHKEPGRPATAKGRLVPTREGKLGVDDVHVKIDNLDGRASLETGRRLVFRLDADPFDVAGWEQQLPALEVWRPTGKLGIEDLVVRTRPLEVRGRVPLDGLQVLLPDAVPLAFSGSLVASGEKVESEALTARLADQPIGLELAILDLAGATAHRSRATAREIDAGALHVAFGNEPGDFSGTLTAYADLSGPLDPETALEALRGRVDFRLEQGRIRGVSPLQRTIDRMGTAGQLAALVSKPVRRLQRLYGDEIEQASGRFELKDGRAHTLVPAEVEYPGYTVAVEGAVRLADLGFENAFLTIRLADTASVTPRIALRGSVLDPDPDPAGVAAGVASVLGLLPAAAHGAESLFEGLGLFGGGDDQEKRP